MDRALMFMLVFFGGGFGCVTRLLIDPQVTTAFSPCNIVACVLMGMNFACTQYRFLTNKFFVSFFSVGLLGGLSTFTPLAVYSLTTEQDSLVMALVMMFLLLAAYTAISAVSYGAMRLFLQYGLKKERGLSPWACARYVMRYKAFCGIFHELRSFYQQHSNNKDMLKAHAPEQLQKILLLLENLRLLKNRFDELKQAEKVEGAEFANIVSVVHAQAQVGATAAEKHDVFDDEVVPVDSLLAELKRMIAGYLEAAPNLATAAYKSKNGLKPEPQNSTYKGKKSRKPGNKK